MDFPLVRSLTDCPLKLESSVATDRDHDPTHCAGQGCLGALSMNKFPPSSGLTIGFSRCPEIGPKVGLKGRCIVKARLRKVHFSGIFFHEKTFAVAILFKIITF